MDRILPWFDGNVDDDTILATYEVDNRLEPHCRVNFVTSLDGASSVDGRTAALGGAGDKRVFDLLRRLADVVLVAAGTVRAEKYGPMVLDDESAAWRTRHGMSPHPVFAIVSGRLNLAPAHAMFTRAPVRPLVLTVGTAPADKREALSRVADVEDCGVGAFDAVQMMKVLHERGLFQVHSEGGPSLFGTMIAADVVDELCLTVSAELVSGDASRIAYGDTVTPRAMRLASLLHQDGVLFGRYVRQHQPEESGAV